MRDIHIQNWKGEINGTSDGRIYKWIKNTFEIEKYLNILNKQQRVALTKIRLSSHLFNIERGRWNKTKREDRK